MKSKFSILLISYLLIPELRLSRFSTSFSKMFQACNQAHARSNASTARIFTARLVLPHLCAQLCQHSAKSCQHTLLKLFDLFSVPAPVIPPSSHPRIPVVNLPPPKF